MLIYGLLWMLVVVVDRPLCNMIPVLEGAPLGLGQLTPRHVRYVTISVTWDRGTDLDFFIEIKLIVTI